jgi:hypothetical protein
MSIFQLLLAIIWLVAIVAIIRSPKTSGGEKIAWVLVTLFFMDRVYSLSFAGSFEQ